MTQRRSTQGFTLIEVLVATVILASALVLIIQSLGRTQSALQISRNLVDATQLGVSKISELELKQREEIRLITQSDQGKERYRGRLYSWESRIGPYQDGNIEDETKLNEAKAVVMWQDNAARRNTLQLNTLLLKRDKEKLKVVSSPEVSAPAT